MLSPKHIRNSICEGGQNSPYLIIPSIDVEFFLQGRPKYCFNVTQDHLYRRIISGVQFCSANRPPYNVAKALWVR
jgi:hypothetical protein